MECDIFATLPKDVTVHGNTVEHKDIKVDFTALFQTTQGDIFTNFITERCISQLLVGRNVVHFLVDAGLEQFLSLCKDIVGTSLEECSKCRVSGYIITPASKHQATCLLSDRDNKVDMQGDFTAHPFTGLRVEEIKSAAMFTEKIGSVVMERAPNTFHVICLTFGFDIIPTSGANITKLYPELSVLMLQSDNLHITKMISDFVNYDTAPPSSRVVSTSLAAITVGFYLGGNFHCSSTFNLRLGTYKNQLVVARNMHRVQSFPIVNDVYSKGLLAKIAGSAVAAEEPADTAAMVTTLKNDLQSMAKDNVQLMQDNEVLHKQLDKVQIDMNNLLNSKQILSEEVRQKLSNEQDIYNKLTEMAVEKVKMKDMSEVKRYELMNRIFSLENDLLNSQLAAEEWKGKWEEADQERTRLDTMKRDLQAEYITLKSNHQSTAGKQAGLERRCETLSLELVQLHMEHASFQNKYPTSQESLPQIKSTSSSRLRSRDTASLSHVSQSRDLVATHELEELRMTLEKERANARSERNRLMQEILTLKARTDEGGSSGVRKEQQKQLLQQSLELQGANETHKRKIKTLEDQLFSCVQDKEGLMEEVDQLKANVNALSIVRSRIEAEAVGLRLKQRNAVEDYRVRLDCYIQDTEKFINRKNPEVQLKPHLKHMLAEYKKSYVEREKELLEEINSTKADFLETLEKYHKISDEYSAVSNTRLIAGELERLRRENKANSEAVQQGKLLPLDKVEDMLGTQQLQYQSIIEKLRARSTKAETQLNRLLSHFNH